MALNTSPISRNLRMNVRFLGLEVEDLFVVAFIAIFFMIGCQFAFPKVTVWKIPLNWFMFLLTIVVGVPGLSAFKYGKPRGYLGDLIKWYIEPKRRDCLSRDTKLTEPYLKEFGEDEDKKKEKANRGN
jgi:hypothetical protein